MTEPGRYAAAGGKPLARIFLSHSSANDAEAVALRDWLTGEGWDDLFLDLGRPAASPPASAGNGAQRSRQPLRGGAVPDQPRLALVALVPEGAEPRGKLNKRIFGILVEDIPVADLPADLTATHQVVNLAAGSDHVMLGGRGRDGGEVRVHLFAVRSGEGARPG